MMLLLKWNRSINGYATRIEDGRLYIENDPVGYVCKHPTDGYTVRLPDFRTIDAVDLGDLVRATLTHMEQSA